jgi:hypothetical protein
LGKSQFVESLTSQNIRGRTGFNYFGGLIMRRHLAALALLSAVAIPTAASAQAITITQGTTTAISPLNDFVTALGLLGYDRISTTGTTAVLDTEAAIDFYFLGSESGYEDTFGAGVLSLTELLNTDNFPGGALIGSQLFSAGTLGGQLGFTSNGGTPAGLGDTGFGVFLRTGEDYTTGFAVTRFIIGYDDQIDGPDDDNHDDLMILGVVRAVPEPGTWATLLFGFGALGAAMRRKASKAPRFRASIA